MEAVNFSHKIDMLLHDVYQTLSELKGLYHLIQGKTLHN